MKDIMINDLLQCNMLILDKNAMFIFSTCLIIISIALGTWYINILLQKAIMTAGKARNLEATFIKAIQNLACIIIYAIGFIVIIENLNIQISAVIKALGFVAIGLSLALQNIMLNIASGIFLLLYKPFCIGDYIKNDNTNVGFEGKVIDINLQSTKLIFNDEIVIIPNSTLYSCIVRVKKNI